jgi:hypothetical protein
MQRDHIGLGKKRFAAGRDFKTRGLRLGGRTVTAPAPHTHAESLADLGHQAADAAIGINAQRLAGQSDTHRALPLTAFQALHFLRDAPQRGKNQRPGQFRRRIRIAAAGGNLMPFSQASISCVGIAAGLADQQAWAAFRSPRAVFSNAAASTPRHRYPAAVPPVRRIFSVSVNQQFVPGQFFGAFEFAESVLIVIDDGDFHNGVLKVNADGK